MKILTTSVVIGALLAVPVQLAIGEPKLTPQQGVAISQLLEEETLQAMAAAQLTRTLATAAKGQTLSGTAATLSMPNPPPGHGGGSGRVFLPPVAMVPKNEPQFALIEILAEVILGGFIIMCVWYAYNNYLKLLDKIFNSPPPPPPLPPQTNTIPAVQFPPGSRLAWDIAAASPTSVAIAAMDLTSSNWTDAYGGPGAKWTRVMQTTIQAREKLTAPWTNYLTFTVWSSSGNGRELLIRDGSNHGIYTNYVRVNANNLYGQFLTPLNMIGTSPAKFYRAAIVQQP